MKRLWDKLTNKVMGVLPVVWGIMWLVIITCGSLVLTIKSIKWLLVVLGVM